MTMPFVDIEIIFSDEFNLESKIPFTGEYEQPNNKGSAQKLKKCLTAYANRSEFLRIAEPCKLLHNIVVHGCCLLLAITSAWNNTSRAQFRYIYGMGSSRTIFSGANDFSVAFLFAL